jgi:hypothetical protein
MTGGEGGHNAVPQFRESIGYTRATISRKRVLHTFKAEQLKKVFQEPLLILDIRHWYIKAC